MLVSVDYARKVWTNHERQSAQARALTEKTEYILPVRFDDTEIPGMPSTVGYLRFAEFGVERICQLVLEKLHRTIPAAPTNAASDQARQFPALEEGQVLTLTQARSFVHAAPETDVKLLRELMFTIELRDNMRGPYVTAGTEIVRTAKTLFWDSISIDKDTARQMLEQAEANVHDPNHDAPAGSDDYERRVTRIKKVVKPLINALPSRQQCVDRIARLPRNVYVPFLQVEFSSPVLQHEYSQKFLFQLMQNEFGLGREILDAAGYIIRKAWHLPHINEEVAFSKRVLGPAFENWYRDQRGIGYEEERASFEVAEQEKKDDDDR